MNTPARKLKIFVYRKDVHFDPSRLLVPESPFATVTTEYKPVAQFAQPDPSLYECVSKPEDAEFFIFPVRLAPLIYRCGIHGGIQGVKDDPDGNERVLDFFRGLRFFEGAEDRHVFFINHHDWPGPYGTRSVVFNGSVRRDNDNPHQVCHPFFVNDLIEETGKARFDIQYHTSFAGYVGSSAIRKRLLDSLTRYLKVQQEMRGCFRVVDAFHHHIKDPALKEARRKEYLETMGQSITVLCPRGTGMNSIRFFEVMSMGKVPVLISDGCVLPLEDEIDWDALIVRVPEDRIDEAGEILAEWLMGQDQDSLIRLFSQIRVTWKTRFAPDCEDGFIANSLRKLLDRRLALGQRPSSA